MFVKNGTGVLKKVLLSKPTYLKPAPINEIAKKWQNTVLDVDKMLEEHRLLVNAYETNGVEVIELKPKESRPNAVFARDFGGCIKEGYILGRFTKSLRDDERVDYEAKMTSLGIPKVAEVTSGYFEGGDFMFLDERTIAIGMFDRSDLEGVAQIRSQLSPYGYEVLGVQGNPDYLHLDMCFNLVTDSLALAHKAGLSDVFIKYVECMGIKLIDVPQEAIFSHGCNVQALGNNRVLALSHNHKINQAISNEGVEVIELEITEILKAGGGPHCMTFPLLRG